MKKRPLASTTTGQNTMWSSDPFDQELLELLKASIGALRGTSGNAKLIDRIEIAITKAESKI